MIIDEVAAKIKAKIARKGVEDESPLEMLQSQKRFERVL
jgi:hypothetical protein